MMEQVCDVFLEKCQSDPSCETETLIQQPGMKEEERESFYRHFRKNYRESGKDRWLHFV